MYRHAGDVVAAHLDLARVNAGPYSMPSGRTASTIASRAVERDAGAGERRDESVAGGVYFAAAESLELVADDAVVVVEQVLPPEVAELGRALGRADDIGENDCGEHTFGVRAAAHAGDELFDLVEHRPVSPTQCSASAPGSSTRRAPAMCSAR